MRHRFVPLLCGLVSAMACSDSAVTPNDASTTDAAPSDASGASDASPVDANPNDVKDGAMDVTADAATATFDYYVSTTGKDSNAGTLAAPWAITSLRDTSTNNPKIAGKRVGLISGTYDISTLTSGSQPGDYQHPVLALPTGTANASTVLGSSDATGHYARGKSVIAYGPSAGVNPMVGQNPTAGGYWTLDGVELDGKGYAGALIDLGYLGGGYTSAGNTPGVVIQNCDLHGITGSPVGDNEALIFVSGTSGAIIANNRLHDAHKPAQPDHCHGYLEYSAQGTQLLDNTIYDCDTGLDVKAGSSGTVIAYNYFYACPVAAVQGVDGAEGNPNTPGTPYIVHHNVIDSCGPAHATDVNGSTRQGLEWYSNTIYDTHTGAVGAMDLRAASSNLVKSYDNVVVCTSNGSGPYTGTIAQSSGFAICDYNDYHFADYVQGWGLNGTVTYNTLSAWQAASGSPDPHAITSDPAFASSIVPGNGPEQFKLASSSPAFGTGRVGGTSSGTACNIGAWDGAVTQIGAAWATYPGP